LEDILARSKNNTLPFELPPPGSTALEIGCGLGQDSRNIAEFAGYSLTSVDVSATAIEEAKQNTPEDMKGSGASQIEFVAYDAFALPGPSKLLDFFFDATVFCGMRHTHLARAYDVWARLFTPGHTLVNIQCWASETDEPHKIGKAWRDMEADFEPMFDILHSEACEKNQGGPGWCFYMKLKPLATREQIAENRLQLQRAARDGDMEFVRRKLQSRHVNSTDAEYWHLYYIARDNSHPWTLGPTRREDKYWQFAYGNDMEDKSKINVEDQVDGQESFHARMEVERLKTEWERAELGEVAMRNEHLTSLSYDHKIKKA
jgi:SAM-dependent methyltransferase